MNNVRSSLDIDSIHKKGITGEGVTIAVIDTGVYSEHRDLKKNVICFNDIIQRRMNPYDDNGHGTHVAGIIAGTGETSNGLYKGIAPDARLVVIKALNRKGKGKAVNVLNAFDWILKNRKTYNIRIVNISVGTIPGSTEEEEFENKNLIAGVEELWNSGIIVIVAAGNNGPDNGTITIPGISPKVITVGMVEDVGDTCCSSGNCSGRGPANCIMKPEIVAPGGDIISCSGSYNGYASKSGTSMATPIVTGVVALLISKNRDMTNKDVKKTLMKNAIDLHKLKQQQGWGMINPKGIIDGN